jgi:hypothetical protein
MADAVAFFRRSTKVREQKRQPKTSVPKFDEYR